MRQQRNALSGVMIEEASKTWREAGRGRVRGDGLIECSPEWRCRCWIARGSVGSWANSTRRGPATGPAWRWSSTLELPAGDLRGDGHSRARRQGTPRSSSPRSRRRGSLGFSRTYFSESLAAVGAAETCCTLPAPGETTARPWCATRALRCRTLTGSRDVGLECRRSRARNAFRAWLRRTRSWCLRTSSVWSARWVARTRSSLTPARPRRGRPRRPALRVRVPGTEMLRVPGASLSSNAQGPTGPAVTHFTTRLVEATGAGSPSATPANQARTSARSSIERQGQDRGHDPDRDSGRVQARTRVADAEPHGRSVGPACVRATAHFLAHWNRGARSPKRKSSARCSP